MFTPAASRRQLESVVRRNAPAVFAHGDPARPAVILLPGVYENWLFLEPVAQRLNVHGFRAFTIAALGFNRRPVADSAALVSHELAALSALHGFSSCILVAHSKGGLIGKRLMLDALEAAHTQSPGQNLVPDAGEHLPVQPGTAAVLGMVAVATPFAGSAYARFLPARSMGDFLPTDAVLLAMQARLDLNHKIVSICPEFDPHIPGGSTLAGAVNIEIPVSGHFRSLSEPAGVAAVEQAVKGLAAQGEGRGKHWLAGLFGPCG